MNRKQNSQKDINEYKIVVPMSNEAVNKIKSNITKSILGVSIAGVMIAGGATQVKAETAENPTAIVQEVKDERKDEYDKALAAAVENILPQKAQALNSDKKEEVDLTSANETSEEKISADESNLDNNVDNAADQEGTTEGKDNITLDEFINDDTLDKFFDFGAIEADAAENIDVEEEKTPEAQTAGEDQKVTEPNYAEDEAKIKDYSKEERYRSSDLPPETEDEYGNPTGGPSHTSNATEMQPKDGFSYNTLEPSKTSEDKTQWGIEMEFDKEESQRTYTDFNFTNSGLLGGVLDAGNISANDIGDKLSDKGDFKDPNYKADANIDITSSRQQRNLNLYATEEDLKHINSIENDKTIIAWEGKYKKDPTEQNLRASQGDNAAFTFTVNPWPNENDKLELIKLNGSHDQKEFVQGQTITTNVKVDNLDASARERLVGQVYHPLTGDVVPGAKAYINDQGKVVVEMPKGTINEDGSINEDSIFYKDAKYKGIQNLEVKFFARPRTKSEFEKIAGNYYGTYTETGAGTETINHDGKDVVIDKQGIDRYDHYNLIGGFKLNLDDTRYYDQDFKDKNQDDTSEHTHSKVKPGEEFNVDLYIPEDKKDKEGNPNKDAFPNQKTPEEMEAAKDGKQAIGSIDYSFIDKINEGKAEEDKWVLKYDEKSLPTTFKITPPKSAKAGDFVAVPLTYTYTNGSTDVHWFHFVVQESDYIKPDYETQVNFPVKEQTSPATVKDDGKRITPDHYTLPDTLETDEAGNKLVTDDSDNKWIVTLDEETGKVSAKPVNPLDFNGGEKLTVPVISHYKDDQKPGEDITEEANAYFVIEEKANMTPRYNAKAGKAGDELSLDVILNEEDRYNRKPGSYSLPDGVEDGNGNKIFTDRSGTEWTVTEDDKGNKTFKNAAGKTWSIYKDEKGNNLLVDDKDNKWIVSVNETTGKVTATVPEGVSNDKLDGALLNVPVVAHYYEKDEDGVIYEVGTKNTEVQFVATGAELNNPQYNVSIGDGNSEMTNSVIINADDKKDSPSSYTIDETKTYTDDNGNEWTVSVDKTTGEVKATPKDSSKLKGGEKLQVPVTAHYGEGDEAPTQNTTAEFVVKDKEYASPDYKAEVVKVGESKTADVKLTDGDNLKKPTKYTLDSDTFVDDKGNTWTVTIDETTGKVTATAPKAAEGKVLNLDGALLNVPVKAHYEDAMGKEVTRKTSVQFMGTGTEGKHTYTEEIPFETKVEVAKDLKPGEWRYKKINGEEQKGKNGSVKKEITIKDSKVEGDAKEIKKENPVDAIIEIGNADYTGTVTNTVTKEVPYTVKIVENPNLDAGTSNIKQQGKPGSKTYKYTGEIVNGKLKEGTQFTEEELTDKYVKPIEHIIEIGTKPNDDMCPAPDPEKPDDDNPGTPGGGDSENPDENPDEKPDTPDTPDTPEESDTPDTPDKPEEPGDTTDTPDEPGDTPEEPGETPDEPGTPEETPEEPEESSENTDTPETIEKPEVDEVEETLDNPNETPEITEEVSSDAKRLPKTGDGINVSIYGYLMGVLGSGFLGLGALKKKKEDEEEEN